MPTSRGGGVAGSGIGRGAVGSTLPRTGADFLVTVGLAMLLGGFGALALSRRRRVVEFQVAG